MEFNRFVPVTKIDPTEHMVYGWASTPDLDTQGEVVELEAIKNALPEYMKFPTVREMHQPSAVGITKETQIHDGKGLYIGAKVIDPLAWEKVKEGLYRGFSIGGRALKKENRSIKVLELSEISLVDSPANKNATITLWKRDNQDNKIAELFLKEVIQMAKRKDEKVEETTEEVVEVAETQEVEAKTPEAEVEAPEEAKEEVVQPEPEKDNPADGEVVVDEVKEASDKPSDLQKILVRLDDLTSMITKSNETVEDTEEEVEKIAKIDGMIAKVDAISKEISDLKERIAKVEATPAEVKVKSAVVEKFDGPKESDELANINKRLLELDAIRTNNLPLYQEKYMVEALGLVAKRATLGK